jgi:hypothetical protein
VFGENTAVADVMQQVSGAIPHPKLLAVGGTEHWEANWHKLMLPAMKAQAAAPASGAQAVQSCGL